MDPGLPRTDFTFQRDSDLTTLETTVLAVLPFAALDPSDQALFKKSADEANGLHVIITAATVFHPQGGGQPTDTGHMVHNGTSSDSKKSVSFEVQSVRMSSLRPDIALHLGAFLPPCPASASGSTARAASFTVGDVLTQSIDAAQRLLYSRYHTAGHLLGAAVRDTAGPHVEGWGKLKASHFPSSAACEYTGLIEGKWKGDIQAKLDEFINADLPVKVVYWDEDEFRVHGMGDLIPDRKALGVAEGEKFRVVEIGEVDAYPCGGTHVETSKLCGKTTVKKITRSNGNSRVGYTCE